MGRTGGRTVALFLRDFAAELIDRLRDSEPLPKGSPAPSLHKRQPQDFANVAPIRCSAPSALDHQIVPSPR